MERSRRSISSPISSGPMLSGGNRRTTSWPGAMDQQAVARGRPSGKRPNRRRSGIRSEIPSPPPARKHSPWAALRVTRASRRIRNRRRGRGRPPGNPSRAVPPARPVRRRRPRDCRRRWIRDRPHGWRPRFPRASARRPRAGRRPGVWPRSPGPDRVPRPATPSICPVRPRPVWISSAMRSAPWAWASLRAATVSGVQGDDAAFGEHGFEEDGGGLRRPTAARSARRVVHGQDAEAFRQRSETLADLVLAGGGHGGVGAAVEGGREGEDFDLARPCPFPANGGGRT